MHKLFLTGLFVLLALLTKAQTTTSVGLDLNYLQSFQEFSYVEDDDLASSFGLGPRIHLGLGVQRLKTNRVFHEYSFIAYSGSKDAERTDGRIQNGVNLLLRWEYGKYFFDLANNRLQLGGALSVDPSLFHTSFDPSNSASFPIQATRVEAGLSFIPRINVQLGERLSLIAKVPIRFAALAYEGSLMENPAQALNENRSDIIGLNLGVDRFQMNVGFRWSL